MSNEKFWEIQTDLYFSTYYNNILPMPKIYKIENDILPNLQGKKILNIFCNFGLTTFALESRGGNVTGLDFNKKSIKKANELKKKLNSNCKFIESDIFLYNTKEQYDIIYASFGILHWIRDISLFLNKIYELLKDSGEFILVDHHSDLTSEILKEYSAVKKDKNIYKTSMNIESVVNIKKGLMGGYHEKKINTIYIDTYLHDTNLFIEQCKNRFKIKSLNYYSYFPYKRKDSDIKVGNNKFRHKNLKKENYMCFSTILKK